MSYKADDLSNTTFPNFEIRGSDLELKVYESAFEEVKENDCK